VHVTEENVTTVDELIALLNHEGQKQTHSITRQISTKTGLIQRSIVQIIRRDFGLKCLSTSNTRRLLLGIASFFIYISRSSVATQLRCGGIFNNRFIANYPKSVPVKKFRKSVNICQRYRQLHSWTFFLKHSVYLIITSPCERIDEFTREMIIIYDHKKHF